MAWTIKKKATPVTAQNAPQASSGIGIAPSAALDPSQCPPSMDDATLPNPSSSNQDDPSLQPNSNRDIGVPRNAAFEKIENTLPDSSTEPDQLETPKGCTPSLASLPPSIDPKPEQTPDGPDVRPVNLVLPTELWSRLETISHGRINQSVDEIIAEKLIDLWELYGAI